jgi:hypothetical protein
VVHFNVLCVIDLNHINNIRKRQNNVEYIDQISYLSLHTPASLRSSSEGDSFCREVTHTFVSFPLLNPRFYRPVGLCSSLTVSQHLQNVFKVHLFLLICFLCHIQSGICSGVAHPICLTIQLYVFLCFLRPSCLFIKETRKLYV